MLKSINELLKTLIKAIGNEPIHQIFGNLIRKIFGLEPRLASNSVHNVQTKGHIEEQKKIYNEYLRQRKKILTEKKLKPNYFKKISVILIAHSSFEVLNISYQSLLKQRVQPNQILIVCSRKQTIPEGVQSYDKIDQAISQIRSEFICFAHSDHRFQPNFIQEFILQVENEDMDLIYCCYDYYLKGVHKNPQWLPQLNQHLLYSSNYIGNTILVKRKFGEKLDWFAIERYPLEYIYDFIIRAIDVKAKIFRVPDILYSILSTKGKGSIEERKAILQTHLQRNNWQGKVIEGQVPNTLRIKWVMDSSPIVSIIIPFRDKVSLLKNCIESILHKTDYANYEIILADNRSQEIETASYIHKLLKDQNHVAYVKVDMNFNYSSINNYAVTKCNGDYLLFLNNDTKILQSSWLSEMLMELQAPEVGVVGAKLLYADETVQHAGVLYGVGHVAGHAFRYLPDNYTGHMDRASIVQEYTAITGACLLTKRSIFDMVNGFDAVNLGIAYNDVDLCLRIKRIGFKSIYTPFAKLYHFESKSRASDLSKKENERYKKECIYMKKMWDSEIDNDIFYHPHVDHNYEDFRLAKHGR